MDISSVDQGIITVSLQFDSLSYTAADSAMYILGHTWEIIIDINRSKGEMYEV